MSEVTLEDSNVFRESKLFVVCSVLSKPLVYIALSNQAEGSLEIFVFNKLAVAYLQDFSIGYDGWHKTSS